MLCFEPRDEVIERRVVGKLESVPKRPFSGAVFTFRSCDRFGETKEWQCKVNKSILVVFELLLAVNDLIPIFKIVSCCKYFDIPYKALNTQDLSQAK